MRSLLAVGALLASSGCEPGQVAEPADPRVEVSRLHKTIREMEAELASVKNNDAILKARINELSAREQELAARLNKLKLINEEQAKQIETLRTAPAERDAYKTRVEILTLEVNRLAAKIIELNRRIAELQHAADLREAQQTTRPAAP